MFISLLKKIFIFLYYPYLLFKESKYFWRYRHIWNKSWYIMYDKNFNFKQKNVLEFIINKFNVKSVLDFGCASGNNLILVKNINKNIHVYGCDISPRAIEYSKDRFFSLDLVGHFSTRLDYFKDIYDLIYCDRVLLYLNDTDLDYTLKYFSKHSKYLLINDFFSSSNLVLEKNSPLHRNYENLEIYGFNLIDVFSSYNEKSLYSENPKIALFAKFNNL